MVQNMKLEEELVIWIGLSKAGNGTATDWVIKDRPKAIRQDTGVADRTFSNEWLHRVERCYGLSQHVQ